MGAIRVCCPGSSGRSGNAIGEFGVFTQPLARLCENSGLWGASPKNGIEGSKKWGRAACAPQALGVEVGTRLANSGFSHSLSLKLTRLACEEGMVPGLPSCATMGEEMPEPPGSLARGRYAARR